jgi:hypothetical protein
MFLMAGLAVSGCIAEEQEPTASSPPPVIGTGPARPSADAKPASSTGNPGSATSAVQTATTPASNPGSGAPANIDPAQLQKQAMAMELDAGEVLPGLPLAGAGGRVGAAGSSSPAGTAGGGGAGRPRGGSGGVGGMGGAGTAGGAGRDPSCDNLACFTVVDCWLLGAPDCNYTTCVNFVCL